MLRKIILVLMLTTVFFLSACSRETENLNTSWQEEVLFASECGYDGLQCCLNTETPCLYEQSCCFSPGNPDINYCSNQCLYGEVNTFCRDTDPQCDDGMVCLDEFCQLAGAANQPCFEGGECNEGLICDGINCVECGLAGNPCCKDDVKPQCSTENILDITRTACVNDICQECGWSQLPLCPDEPVCNPSHLINNQICLSCGGYNQPCCKELESGYKCDGPSLVCESGFCSTNN